MNFTNPAFLWAMFAVAIPIIIHLINFRRFKTLYFSNTAFLENIKKETQTRTKIKNILILLARILTIAMLVFAFSGPFLPYTNNSSDNNSPTISVIYLDNSFSMEAENKNGQNFEEAKQIAKQIILNSEANIQYLFVTNDMLPEHQTLISRDDILQYIDNTVISSTSAHISDIILKANTIIPHDKNANFYMISDMQKSFLSNINTKLNDNISIVFIPLNGFKINNLYIDTCYFDTPVHKLSQQEELIVKITNNSTEDMYNVPLQLYLNDSLKIMSSINIESQQSQEITLNYINATNGQTIGKLEITDYPITYDNTLYFNYNVSDLTNILIINKNIENKYLTAVFNSDNDNFKLSQIKLGNEQNINYGEYDVIVLNDVTEISSGLSAMLQTFTANGGTLVFIPSGDINVVSCNNFLSMFNAGKFEDLKFNNEKVYYIDYKHNIFKNVFVKEEKQSELPSIGMAYKYIINSTSVFSSIISLENNNPLLVAGNYKSGKLYVFSSTLIETNSEFLKSSLFVPAFINIALNSQINNPLYATIDKNTVYEINTPYDVNEYDVFRVVNDKTDVYSSSRISGKMIFLNIPSEIKESGNYRLQKNDNLISPISLNYNRKESDMQYYNNEELENYAKLNFNKNYKILKADSKNTTIKLKDIAKGKQLWQFFIVLAFFFVLCELFLIKFRGK